MTRTEKLGLCTWVENDPVSLTEMNENFTKLDTFGAQAISCADAAGINIAGLLLHSHHAGEDISFASRAAVGDLTRNEDASEYENVYFSRADGALLLQEGYAGETRSVKESNGSSLTMSASKSPKYLMSFTPTGYANLNYIVINTYTSVSGSFTDQVKLYCGGQLVAESAELVNTESSKRYELSFSNVLLNPNKTYDIYFITDRESSRIVTDVEVQSTPVIYTSGWLISQPVQLPAICERAVVHIYAGGTPFTLEYRLNGGAWNDAAPASEKQAASQTGAACTLSRFDLPLAGAQTLELRMALPAADSVVYGYSGAIL